MTPSIYSPYGSFSEGDHVTRDGTDVQLVKDMTDDGFAATFVCVVAPASGWIQVGEEERNVCRRYSRVVKDGVTGKWEYAPGELTAWTSLEPINLRKALKQLVNDWANIFWKKAMRALVCRGIPPSRAHQKRYHRNPKRRALRKR